MGELHAGREHATSTLCSIACYAIIVKANLNDMEATN